MGIDGAIITTVIAYVSKILVQVYFAKSHLKGKFDLSLLKNWLKNSWLPLYSNLGHVASVIDVIIYSIVTGSVTGVSYYAVSNTIASTIAQSSNISQALYPKLLAKGNFDYVKNNFTRLMYFAIPLLGICIVFSKPALFTLNPAYVSASNLVIILAFRTFFYAITSTLYQILLGMETVDVEKDYRFLHLAKSKLFLIPTLTAIQFISYIVFLTFTIFILHLQHSSETVMTTWWCVISLVAQIPFLIYAWLLLRKNMKFSIEIKDVLKYVSGTVAFCLVFLITSPHIIEYKTRIYDFLPGVIFEFIICIGVYLLVTYCIDKKTRFLIKSILGEIKSI